MRPWVKWLVNRNMKFVVLGLWLVSVPLYFLLNASDWLEESAKDALVELQAINELKKGEV